MLPKLQNHVEPEKGWLNDPNGLCWFQGRYHAFFQHHPDSTVWKAPLHWGHAVSDDLIHWEEQPIALYPDQPYENGGGCFSGSAIEKDGKLYLMYTAVSKGHQQTQCVAVTEDCIHFTKLPENPLIGQCPLDPLSVHFRDPKVFQWKDGTYRMVCGGSDHQLTTSAVMLYKSEDLLHWEYVGPIFQTSEMGPVLECPDLFPLGDKWVLDFSRMDKPQCVQFVVGDFDGEHFTPESFQRPVIGPQFYAPQTFLDPQGRRILIGWMTPWGQPEDPDAVRCGCLTIPMEVSLNGAGNICLAPVAEAAPYLVKEDPHVRRGQYMVQVTDGETIFLEKPVSEVQDIQILPDTHTCEVFINGGETVCCLYFQP